MLTRTKSCKKLRGQPSHLNATEPPSLRHLIRNSYCVKSSNPGWNNYGASKIIAKDVIHVWRLLSPRLPLYNKYYGVKKSIKRASRRQRVSTGRHVQQSSNKILRNPWQTFLHFCVHLPSAYLTLQWQMRESSVEIFQTQHLVCLRPPSKKLPIEEREYLKDQGARNGRKGSFQVGSMDKDVVRTMRKRWGKYREIWEEDASHEPPLDKHVLCSSIRFKSSSWQWGRRVQSL